MSRSKSQWSHARRASGPSIFILMGIEVLLGAAPSPAQASPEQTLQQSHPVELDLFGRSVAVSGTTAVVGASQASATVPGAAYVFVQSPDGIWSPQAGLTSSLPGPYAFGAAVAVSGDTVMVGAPVEQHIPVTYPAVYYQSGAVHVFQRSGLSWTETGRFESPWPSAWEWFGNAIALQGDDLVVAAYNRDVLASIEAGAVFVYHRSGGIWGSPQELSDPAAVISEQFGRAVDLAADTLVVSAPNRDPNNGAIVSGAVFVYQRSGGVWSLAQSLQASDRATGDVFGTSLDLEVHADGSARLVVGAEAADPGALLDAGAAYVFDAPVGGSFTQTQKLVAVDATAGAHLGSSVALAGDRVLLGARGADGGAAGAGASYVFELSGGLWTQQAKLIASTGMAGDELGAAVVLSGAEALVGASGQEIGSAPADAGALHVFAKPATGAWLHAQMLNASWIDANESYGSSLALAGDLLAASGRTSHGDVFARDGLAWSEAQALPLASGMLEESSVATDGTSVAVFSKITPVSGPAKGTVQVFDRSNGLWLPRTTFHPDFDTMSLFDGEAADDVNMSILGGTLAIGAPRWHGGEGRVFIWTKGKQSQVLTGSNSSNATDLHYGAVVKLNGRLLIVAEVPRGISLPPTIRPGTVHVFSRTADGRFAFLQDILAPTPSDTDDFGRCIAIDGDLLAIYAPSTKTVHVYQRREQAERAPFQHLWEQTIEGVTSLAMKGNRIAVGAGQILVYDKQPNNTYQQTRTFTTNGAVVAVDLNDARVVASTSSGLLQSFDL